jgi:sugar lactone lactonase YvrE
MAYYFCSSGYTLSGTSPRICQATGVWTGTAPTCVGGSVSCPSLSAPAGGTVSASLRSPGAVATYSCGTGYTLVGAATRTCQSDGTWSGTAPTCAGVDCGPPGAPSNGSVSAPTTTYPSTATFSCSSGFSLSGLTSIACQSNGTWSGAVPTCVCSKTMCNGTCIDTAADVNHCGGCNTICPTPTAPSTVECAAGRCLTTLATTTAALALAVDATSVYWSTYAGNILSVPLAGGAAKTLATGQSEPEDIAVAADGVYWVNYTGGTVMKASLAGGDATAVLSGQSYPSGIVVDASNVYFAGTGIGVRKISHSGGTVTPLATGTGVHPWKLALGATNVYWADTGAVMSVPLGGGSYLTLSSGLPGTRDVATNGVYAFAANPGTSANSHTDGSVTRVPIGGGATTVLASAQAMPYSIAADATSVYWADLAAASAGGAIMRVAVDGSNLTALVPGRSSPDCIAVDATSVYWIDRGKNSSGYAVMKTPK